MLKGCSFRELENIGILCLYVINLKELKELLSCGEQVVLLFFYLFSAVLYVLNISACLSVKSLLQGGKILIHAPSMSDINIWSLKGAVLLNDSNLIIPEQFSRKF